jgi:hypothetical protein
MRFSCTYYVYLIALTPTADHPQIPLRDRFLTRRCDLFPHYLARPRYTGSWSVAHSDAPFKTFLSFL